MAETRVTQSAVVGVVSPGVGDAAVRVTQSAIVAYVDMDVSLVNVRVTQNAMVAVYDDTSSGPARRYAYAAG